MDYEDAPNINKLSEYKKAVIPYIAGYAVKMTKKNLSYEECSAALMTGEIMNGSFFEKKRIEVSL